MKFTLFDFLRCLVLQGSILWLSILMGCSASAFTAEFMGEYHIIADSLLVLFTFGILCALAIRVLLMVRPLAAGEFDMDHANFIYWKLLMMTFDVGRFVLRPFTTLPAVPLVAKLYGAKIGKSVAIGGTIEDPYLVTIGDHSVIGNQSLISCNMSMNGKITLGKVVIGNHVTVGANSVIMPNVEIGDNVLLAIGSVVQPGTRIPAGESWRGNPARKWL